MTRGLMIAAPRSGSGKTTVTLGLLRAFRRRGVDVVGLKSGPDYIDPAFHAAASGREGVNLDSWAMSPSFWPPSPPTRRAKAESGLEHDRRYRACPRAARPLRRPLDRRGRFCHARRAAARNVLAQRERRLGPVRGDREPLRSSQARWSIPLAGAAGFWMVWRLGLWGVLVDGSLWWLDAMAAYGRCSWRLSSSSSLSRMRASPKWPSATPRPSCDGSGARISCCSRRRASRSSAPSPARTAAFSDDALSVSATSGRRRDPPVIARPPASACRFGGVAGAGS